ncbi:hypothetical protein FRB95_006534 [Tulasnella sp. JGI-2019a]|nr:hypothetical protein FRB93_010635 [Tulasnella sp. JGI-2019a]KAG9028403.1 hypothetical protein FRB95_006534 [Tulasnella sp. JGI-2019a]
MIQHHRLCNHNRPLYRLPLDIVVQILSLALQDDRRDPYIYMEWLRTFASVSHQWLRLVKETPSFWRVVSSDLPLPLLRQALSRSAGHSLDVVYSEKRHSDIPRSQFTTLVVEHVQRWRSLIVREDTTMDMIIQCLVHLSAPALDVLTCYRRDSAAVDLFSGEARQLYGVTLQEFRVPWEPTTLSGLQILHLEALQANIPSGVELLAILTASPGLVELRLKDFESHTYDYPTLPQNISVGLPMLETLSVVSIPQQLTHDLLAAIHIPRCTSFEISYEETHDSDVGLFNNSVLAHIASLLVTHIHSSPLITIEWGDKGGVIDLSTSTGAVTITFWRSRDTWCHILPAGLSNALEKAGPPEIHLNFARRPNPSALLTLLGPSRCHVTKIHMSDQESWATKGLMELLAEPTIVDTVAQWPLPRLRHVSFVDSELRPKGLIEAISSSSRYRSVSGSRKEVTNRVEDVDKLRKLLGDSNFSYVTPLANADE